MDAKFYQLMEKARNQGEEFQIMSYKQQALASRMMDTLNELITYIKASKDQEVK